MVVVQRSASPRRRERPAVADFKLASRRSKVHRSKSEKTKCGMIWPRLCIPSKIHIHLLTLATSGGMEGGTLFMVGEALR